MQLPLTADALVPVGVGVVIVAALVLLSVLLSRRRRRPAAVAVREPSRLDETDDVAASSVSTAQAGDGQVLPPPGRAPSVPDQRVPGQAPPVPASADARPGATTRPERGEHEPEPHESDGALSRPGPGHTVPAGPAAGPGRTVAAAVAQAFAVRAAAAGAGASASDRPPGVAEPRQVRQVAPPPSEAPAAAPAHPPTQPRSEPPQPPAPVSSDARDRLLAVLLDDPVRAVGATVELEACRNQLARLTDAVRHERGVLGEVLHRLAGTGLRPEQLARLAEMPLAEVASLLAPADSRVQ